MMAEQQGVLQAAKNIFRNQLQFVISEDEISLDKKAFGSEAHYPLKYPILGYCCIASCGNVSLHLFDVTEKIGFDSYVKRKEALKQRGEGLSSNEHYIAEGVSNLGDRLLGWYCTVSN